MSSYPDQIEQVDRDLAEIGVQVDAGEIDPLTAERLRESYERERAALITAQESAGQGEVGRSPGRAIAGVSILAVGVALIAIFAVVSLQDDNVAGELTEGVATGVAEGSSGVDLSTVSIEEMEVVVADNPSIIGMRLALAERYVEAGDHSGALDHYLIVLDQEPDQPEALAMIGWLTYQAGEPELAEPFVARALEIEPDYPLALWFLANIRVDNGDLDGAVIAVERFLAYDLSAEVRSEAERFLAEVGR